LLQLIHHSGKSMFRKTLLLSALLGSIVGLCAAASFEGLPEAVQAARQTPLTQPVNVAECHSIASELIRLAGTYSTSSYVPEAFLLAARLENATGDTVKTLEYATHVLKSYPGSESTPAAFELAWNTKTNGGKDPMAGMPMARDLAVSLGTKPAAGYYYEMAFNACRDSQHWRDALTIGDQYLKSCTASAPNPRLVLSLGDVALMAAETPLAQQWLETYLDRYPNLPQTVAVRTKLGQMYAASGNTSKAQEMYSVAWTTYQKHADKGDYQQPEIAEAAAFALWELQDDSRRDFENLTAVSGDLDKSLAERRMNDLIAAYTQVMKTDAHRAPQALNAIADAHARYADALLKEGFRVALNSSSPSTPVPYYSSSQEYQKAIAFYSQANDRATGSDNAELQKQARYAASHAFELTSGEGDAVFAWAIHLYEIAPQAAVGEHGNQSRIAYLNQKVLPKLEDGLACKSEALALTKTLPVQKEAAEVRQTLDMPVRPILSDLAAMTQNEVHEIETSSTELAGSFKAGFQPISTKTLAESLEVDFAYASKLSASVQATLEHFYQTFEQNGLPDQSLAFWEDQVATASYNYAAACREMQDDLAACVGQLAIKKDDTTLPLYNRMTRLQAKGATEEFAGLVKWHDFATQNHIQAPIADKLQARLAELDPMHYGAAGGINSASRKKP
jgi:tetratricopeptide (TPR) repeat protein